MSVLYFSADWCAPCKAFKPVVQQVSQQLGISVNYVNVDYDASLAQKYSISSIPTIIITDDQGNSKYKNSGVMSKDQLVTVLSQFK